MDLPEVGIILFLHCLALNSGMALVKTTEGRVCQLTYTKLV